MLVKFVTRIKANNNSPYVHIAISNNKCSKTGNMKIKTQIQTLVTTQTLKSHRFQTLKFICWKATNNRNKIKIHFDLTPHEIFASKCWHSRNIRKKNQPTITDSLNDRLTDHLVAKIPSRNKWFPFLSTQSPVDWSSIKRRVKPVRMG